jgi:hypothetical protein
MRFMSGQPKSKNVTYGEFAISAYPQSRYLACYSIIDELKGRHHDELTAGELIFWLTWNEGYVRIGDFLAAGGIFYAREILAALKQIQARQLANKLQAAVDIVGLPDPMPDSFDFKPSTAQKDALERLDAQRSTGAFEELQDRLFTYLKHHVNEFSRPYTKLTEGVLREQLLPEIEIEGKFTHICRCQHGFEPSGKRVHEKDVLVSEIQSRAANAEAKKRPHSVEIYRRAIERLQGVPDEEGVSQWIVSDASGRVAAGYSTPQRLIWIWPIGYPEYDYESDGPIGFGLA